jgi:hypothetical protein
MRAGHFACLMILLTVLILCAQSGMQATAEADPTGVQMAPALLKLASDWEPELYAELGSAGPARFYTGLLNPCVADARTGAKHCVPGAYILGNWQSNAKGLGALIGAHPNISAVGNERCFAHWTNDKAGRQWLRKRAPEGFDPSRQVLAALGCVTMLTFYPGFAGRFHKYWEESYWPCKAECVRDKQCEREYFSPKGRQWPCKLAALRHHESKVSLPRTADSPALNVTPPYLMRAFYGTRVRLLAVVRSPIDRLRHAFYAHPHYARKYGKGADGLEAYAKEQVAGWRACVEEFGSVRVCAVHFEQLGSRPNDVFFHCDQLIRSMYAPFVRDWLGAFPEHQLLLVRTEDVVDDRRSTLTRVWRHLGLPSLFESGREVPSRMSRAESRLPQDYRAWTQGYGPIKAETTELLRGLYAPLNLELRNMLRDAANPSCRGTLSDLKGTIAAAGGAPPVCDSFLWEATVD